MPILSVIMGSHDFGREFNKSLNLKYFAFIEQTKTRTFFWSFEPTLSNFSQYSKYTAYLYSTFSARVRHECPSYNRLWFQNQAETKYESIPICGLRAPHKDYLIHSIRLAAWGEPRPSTCSGWPEGPGCNPEKKKPCWLWLSRMRNLK